MLDVYQHVDELCNTLIVCCGFHFWAECFYSNMLLTIHLCEHLFDVQRISIECVGIKSENDTTNLKVKIAHLANN